MIMNPFEQSKQQLLHFLASQVEQEVIDYIRRRCSTAHRTASQPQMNCSLLPIAGRTD